MSSKKKYDPNEGAPPGHAVLHTAYVPHTMGNLVQILQEAHNKVGPQIMHMPLRVVLTDDAPEAMGWGISPHEVGHQEFALMLQAPGVATGSVSEVMPSAIAEVLKRHLLRAFAPPPELNDDDIDDAAKEVVADFLKQHKGQNDAKNH